MTSRSDLVTESVLDLELTGKNDEIKNKTVKGMTCMERFSYIKEIVTVEPIIGAYVSASFLCLAALYNLEIEKSCRANLKYNDTVCDALLTGEEHNFTVENQEVQKTITNMHSWQSPMQILVPLILVLFLGSYSDRHKLRKPFILVPIFGEFFAVAGCVLCVIFMKEWPLEIQGVLQTIVPSLFGGQAMVTMAVFAYIADVSTIEMRTLRVGIIQIVLNICTPVAQYLGGVLYDEIGYIGLLTIALGLYGFAVAYGVFCLKEPKQSDVVFKENFFIDAFNPKRIWETLSTFLKNNAQNNRTFILILFTIFFIYSGVSVAEGSIFYLYGQGFFMWTPFEFSNFSTVNTIIHLIGTFLGVAVFTKIFNLSDFTILFLTFADKIVSNIVFALAKSNAAMYVAAGVSIIIGITPIALRSIATKVVSENDLGKAQSMFAIFEALGGAVAVPIYNSVIYNNTINTFPSAFFVVGSVIYSLCLPIFIWMNINYKKKENVTETLGGIDNNLTKHETTHM